MMVLRLLRWQVLLGQFQFNQSLCQTKKFKLCCYCNVTVLVPVLYYQMHNNDVDICFCVLKLQSY